jgi:hypothetical protein
VERLPNAAPRQSHFRRAVDIDDLLCQREVMKRRSITSSVAGGFAMAAFMLAAGCQSGGSGGVLGLNGDKPREQVLQSELTGYCPRVQLREGTAYFTTYAKGGQDDKDKIVYQASISDVTRSCSRANGMLTLKIAVAGRVVPGPAGGPGTATMPIRVAVARGEEVLYSELHRHAVAVGEGSGATQFMFANPDITIPVPADGSLQVFAGYDEGPPTKRSSDAEAF